MRSGEDRWQAQRVVSAEVDEVLVALTDPDTLARWAPVGFDVCGLRDNVLRAGSRASVRGAVAGVGVSFEVAVDRADCEALELTADGPVPLEVAYRLSAVDAGTAVEAEIAVGRGSGLCARLVRGAVVGLLNGGALGQALGRLEREIDAECVLLAA